MKIPELETERLILRRHEEKDFADMREYLSDEKVVAFEPYLPMSAMKCGSASESGWDSMSLSRSRRRLPER